MDYFHTLLAKAQTVLGDEAAVELIEKTATKTAYAASGVTVISGLTVNDWGVIVGMIAAMVTTGFNIWFKLKYSRPQVKREK